MPNPRWNKVMRDLWLNFGRSILIVLSIAVGVSAIGVGIGTQQTLAVELPASYARTLPSSASLICDPFDEDMVDIVRKVPGVTAAQARFLLNTQVQTSTGSWQSIQLVVYPDYQDLQVNKISPVSGTWPVPDRQILIERGSISLTGSQPGDLLTLQMPDGTNRELKIAGLVHDLSQPAGVFSNQVSGYITISTLEWLGYSRNYNEILIATNLAGQGETADLEQIQKVAGLARSRIESNGGTVFWTTVQDPGQHWFQPYLIPIISFMDGLGVLALLLSGFLVINTISALLAQQIRQIGMMKAIGGRVSQISGIFTSMVTIFGVLALAIAVPLGTLGTRICLQLISGYINFDPPTYQLSTQTVIVQAALSILVPLFTAIFPIHSGTHIPVLKALNFNGMGTVARPPSASEDDRLARFNIIPHPLLLSLRNTFRRKSRLILTLITLTIGSAIFIAVQNVQASLLQTLDQTLQYYNFDVVVFFSRPFRVEQLIATTMQIPSVKAAETWGASDAHRVRADESESDSIMFAGPPVDTEMIRPILVEGRWLLPQDENAVVINTDLLRMEPDLRVGSTLTLSVNGKDSQWVIVGVVKSVLLGPWAYANQPYFSYKLGQYGLSSAIYLTTWQHGEDDLRLAVEQIDEHLRQGKLHFDSISTVDMLKQATILQFQVLTGFLMSMALLVALVGGLGLTGTMSLNVIERSREIGLLRVIGARNYAIHSMVITEGIFIGVLSWFAGCVLSLPLGKLLGNIIGEGFLRGSLNDAFSPSGALIWLAIILVFSTLASLAPAHQATRFPIREVLAHE